MTKGRKVLPSKIKTLRGTNQPCRIGTELNVTPIINPIKGVSKSCPLKNKRAKKIFIEKSNQLIANGILTDFDIEQLSIYAYALDQAYTCMENISDQGLFKEIFDDNGNILRYVQNPHLPLFRDMVDIANKIGSDFGFSPVSRQKIKAETPKDEDDLIKILNG